MIGCVIADIVGSVYEFNNYKATDFEPFFHPASHWTDDTVLVVAVADALLNRRDPAVSLKDWCTRYWENGGWGRQFALWLGSDSMTGYNSFGNGAAARCASAGYIATTLDEALRLSRYVTECTHDHPEGLKGAAATASAIFLAKSGNSKEEIRFYVTDRFGYDLSRTTDQIRSTYRYTESCQGSVPQAITCALEGTSYESTVRLAVSLGGDSDTIACISGSIAECLYGVPGDIAEQGWAFLPDDMKAVLRQLYSYVQ